MVMFGNGLTVTACDAVLLQPLAAVTVTLYVPPLLTVMFGVVLPSLHRYDAPPVAVSVVF